MHNLDDMIEKYRQELVEFSRQMPVHNDEYRDFVPTAAVPIQETNNDNEVNNNNNDEDEVKDIIEIRPYRDNGDFEARNGSTGSLRVQVFAADRSFPVSNARVRVTVPFLTGSRELFDGRTDADGIVENITLPAPNKSLSLDEDNTSEPFALYNITIDHPNYAESVFSNVPIFDSVKSIQPVELVPLTRLGNEPEQTNFGGEM